MSSDAALIDVLQRAQRLGSLGDRPVEEVIAHARLFLPALAGVTGPVADIGSGAGVPGLIIALDRPDLAVTLIDRRATRMDEVRRAVQALGWEERVSVVTADVKDLSRDSQHAFGYEAVVSRGFGPPDTTVRLARGLIQIGGRLVVTEPPKPDPNRWPLNLLQSLGLSQPQYLQGIAMFHVEQLPL